MSAPQHGEYDPAQGGFYSAVTRHWHRDPTKIGEVVTHHQPTELEREAFADSKMGRNGRAKFKPVPDLEGMLRLRDSDRPEDRANYQQLAAGSRRIQVADYETKRTEAIAAGDWQPPTTTT